MSNKISGVILAGGSNNRFHNITKANIVIDGKTIISRMIESMGNLFDEIIIVANKPDEFAEFANCKLVSDHFLNSGPLGGIHAGLKASSNESIFVFASDMPLLNREIIIRQIQFYSMNICDLLVPRINNNIEPLHSICNTSVIKTLEEYLQDNCDLAVSEFFKLLNVKYLLLESSEEVKNAFLNINSPSDIVFVEKILGI